MLPFYRDWLSKCGREWSPHVGWVRICMCIGVFVRLCTCVCVDLQCVRVCVCLCKCLWLYVCLYVCESVCVHISLWSFMCFFLYFMSIFCMFLFLFAFMCQHPRVRSTRAHLFVLGCSWLCAFLSMYISWGIQGILSPGHVLHKDWPGVYILDSKYARVGT